MYHSYLNWYPSWYFDFFQSKEFPTFKDNDFTRDNVKLYIGDEKKSDVIQKIKNDIKVISCRIAVIYYLIMHHG